MPTKEDLYQYGRFALEAERAWDKENQSSHKPIDVPDGYEVRYVIQAEASILGIGDGLQFFGFVAATRAKPHDVVVSWRGTEGWKDWVDDLEGVKKIHFHFAEAGQLHQGFHDIYHSTPCRDPLLGELKKLLDAGDVAALHVTGHSLGAALAVINTLDIVTNLGVQPLMWTFAGPRVGDTHFKNAFDAAVDHAVRVVNKPDVVPKVPPWELGYHHVKGEYEIDSTGVAKHSVGCRHAMTTYLHLLDPSSDLSPNCVPGS